MAKSTENRQIRFSRWSPDEIVVGDRLRNRLQEDVVSSLMESIKEIGLREPPTIRIEHDEEQDGGDYPVLVAGLHRVEACKRLGLDYVDCVVFEGDAIEARKWEIAENLHRAELTVQERAEHVAEWVRLTEQGIPAQVAPKIAKDGSTRGRPESGINAAVRELGIDRTEAQRAVKIASITPKAKEAAAAAGLADNQTALLTIARAEPEQQAQAVKDIVQRKAQKVDRFEAQLDRIWKAFRAADPDVQRYFAAQVPDAIKRLETEPADEDEPLKQPDLSARRSKAEKFVRAHGIPELVARLDDGSVDVFDAAKLGPVRP